MQIIRIVRFSEVGTYLYVLGLYLTHYTRSIVNYLYGINYDEDKSFVINLPTEKLN